MKPTPSAEASSYGRVAAALHWLIGLALLGQIVFGFLLDELAPRGTPARGFVINLHKSFGLVLLALIVIRVGWRLAHRAPPWPASMSLAQQRAARLGHRALYACMLVQPLAGYIASNFSKYGVKFFGVAFKPWGADMPAVYAFFNGLHVVTAFVFTALIAGHVMIALKHALIDHDGMFARIWPRNRSPETP
jgi:cytochrome b561